MRIDLRFAKLSVLNVAYAVHVLSKKIRRKIRIKIFWLAKWEKFAFPIFFYE